MTTTKSQTVLNRVAFVLLWLFVFTLPLSQATEIPAIGAISQAIGLAALAAGVAAVIERRQIRLLSSFHLLMGGFILWSALTLCWSISPQLTVQRIVTYLQLFVLVLLIWELCREEKDVLRILSAFVLGTILPALSTLQAFLPGQQTLYERAAKSGFDPNSLAFMLAISLPVSYYLTLQHKSALTALYRLQMGFAFCAALLYGSAATLIAMVIGLSLVCWTIHLVPMRIRRNAFALTLLIGTTTFVLIPSSVVKHIMDETQKGGISLTAVLNTGAERIQTTPVGGFGAGTLATAANHPTFIMFAETGVVGVLAFIAIIGILFLAADEMSGASKSFWFTVLAIWTVGVCCLSWECTQPAWLLFGLLAAHSASLRKPQLAAKAVEAKPHFVVEQEAELCS